MEGIWANLSFGVRAYWASERSVLSISGKAIPARFSENARSKNITLPRPGYEGDVRHVDMAD
jgi:hypothetical protein